MQVVFQNTRNVGIGVPNPVQRLDVAGNVQFSGALMPAGIAGLAGQVLTSQGPGAAPVWQSIVKDANNPNGVPKIGVGRTQPGVGWQQYTPGFPQNALYIDVDISACGFTQSPYIFTSLGGTSYHWITTGATSIYDVTPTSFRIYLNGYKYATSGNAMHVNPLRTMDAANYRYPINWIAIGY
ncbi:MAG: hypothetical protein ACUVRD_00825 [Bacteroidia bacterium]